MASLLRKYRKHHGMTGVNRPRKTTFMEDMIDQDIIDTTSEKEEKLIKEDIKTEEPATSGFVDVETSLTQKETNETLKG